MNDSSETTKVDRDNDGPQSDPPPLPEETIVRESVFSEARSKYSAGRNSFVVRKKKAIKEDGPPDRTLNREKSSYFKVNRSTGSHIPLDRFSDVIDKVKEICPQHAAPTDIKTELGKKEEEEENKEEDDGVGKSEPCTDGSGGEAAQLSMEILEGNSVPTEKEDHTIAEDSDGGGGSAPQSSPEDQDDTGGDTFPGVAVVIASPSSETAGSSGKPATADRAASSPRKFSRIRSTRKMMLRLNDRLNCHSFRVFKPK
mmetsp:Transcript_12871/g.25754  ORF Transcript_12871/g.25754 Transcript_12871/m.25754 type:complete len:256 (-) Transcript_12871:359-1126(-)